jgi:hypothetical protein
MSGRYMEVRGLQPGPVYGLKVVAVVANCEAEGGRQQHFCKIYMLNFFYLVASAKYSTKKGLKLVKNFFLSKFATIVLNSYINSKV